MTARTDAPPSPADRGPDPRNAAIETIGLTKIYRDFWGRPRVVAVDDLTLTVRRGEVLGLLGPNGSGKSTTIKLLLGLLEPTRGVASILGRPPRDVAVKRRIGYLPEASAFYRYLTGRETLEFFGRIFDLDPRERRRRADRLMELAGLEGAAGRRVGEYSKGMARRLGIAQALLNDPELVILDEPTAGLDPIGTREVKDLIRGLRARGKTVLLSSHLLAQVEDVCDRIAILYGGKLRAVGAVGELLARADRTRIECRRLGEGAIRAVVDLLRREAGGGEVRVRTPRVRLEAYFLDVVARAEAERLPSSGARAARGIERLLDREERGEAPPAPAPAPAPAPEGEPGAACRGSEDRAAEDREPERPDEPAPPPAGEGIRRDVIERLLDGEEDGGG